RRSIRHLGSPAQPWWRRSHCVPVEVPRVAGSSRSSPCSTWPEGPQARDPPLLTVLTLALDTVSVGVDAAERPWPTLLSAEACPILGRIAVGKGGLGMARSKTVSKADLVGEVVNATKLSRKA